MAAMGIKAQNCLSSTSTDWSFSLQTGLSTEFHFAELLFRLLATEDAKNLALGRFTKMPKGETLLQIFLDQKSIKQAWSWAS